MSDWKKKAHTPEKDAVDVYGTYPDNAERRIAHVDCLRSQVIPRDELIEELLEALRKSDSYAEHDELCAARHSDSSGCDCGLLQHFDKSSELLIKAYSHGYGKPTES